MAGDFQEVQVPEWEHVAAGRDTTAKGARLPWLQSQKLDRVLPPHRKYLGLSRNTFLLVCVGATIAVLALVIGLAVGLTRHSHAKDVPLPSNTQTFTGDLTYFAPGLGACGETDTSSDHIVAVSHILFDAAGSSSSTGGDSNDNPLCNLTLRAERYDEAVGATRSVDLKVVDRCTGCEEYDLDTTDTVFASLAPIASGRVDVTWAWLQPVATRR